MRSTTCQVPSSHFTISDEMKAVVDAGTYELAIALHPVSLDELMAVADVGLEDASRFMHALIWDAYRTAP